MPVDVVIAGAGPNGLMLACELALAGIRPLVLERLTGPSGEQRANGLVGQVVRMLDRRGLYEKLAGSSEPPKAAPGFMFGAFGLDLSVLTDNPVYLLMVPQRRIEQVLAERAVELGVELRRGHELVGLVNSPDQVTVEIAGPEGNYAVEAKYLVGADGGHSLTRKLAGIDFPGITTDRTISRTAHVSLPAELIDPIRGGLVMPGYGVIPPFLHHRTETGLFVFAPFPTGAPMITSIELQDIKDDDNNNSADPLTIGELRDSVRRVLGVDLPFGPPQGEGRHLLRRRTGGNTRLADQFRANRVLLVGDAAHVHSAIGGPGLNLGLQDAINLGWKLGAELHGWAPTGLLDSYQSERRPAGERVNMQTQAQAVLTRPGREVTALRTLFGELLADPRTVQHLADLLSGADLRYDMGDLTGSSSPLIGRWAPDLLLHTETGPLRLAELTRTARPLLLDLTDGAALADLAKPWQDRVDVVTARAAGDLTGLLLRPDCYLAWASTSSENQPPELIAALTRWFGSPTG